MADIARPAAIGPLADAHKQLAEKNWQGVVDALDAQKQKISTSPMDIRARQYALRGLALHMMGDTKAAEQSYRKVINYLPNAKKRLGNEIGKQSKDFDSRLAALHHVLGEALFYMAEIKREKVDELAFPMYDGEPDAKAVKKHFDRNVAHWSRRRDKAIGKVVSDYGKLAGLKPEPTAWKLASAARTAQMWIELVAEAEKQTVPEDWAKAAAAPAPSPAAAAPAKPAPAAPAKPVPATPYDPPGKPAPAPAAQPNAGAPKPAPVPATPYDPPGKPAPAPAVAPAPAPDSPAKKAAEAYAAAYQAMLAPLKKKRDEALAACAALAAASKDESAHARYCTSRMKSP